MKPAVSINIRGLSKFYKLYDSPRDRLKEALHPFKKKYHREFFALKDVHLTVRRKEIVGVVGRNGAGKSTLLKIIAGVVPASSGELMLKGSLSAMLDIQGGLNPEFTGLENIRFVGTMMGFSQAEMKRKMEEVIAFAEIGQFIGQPLKTYSTGMKARLGFAVAVNVDPEILVIDEFLSVGDELFRRKCHARIEELLKSDCTVLYVSHNLNNVNELCTRTIFLDQGRLLLDGPSKMVTMYYQKLLYANPEEQQAVREEIRLLNQDRKKKQLFVSMPEGDGHVLAATQKKVTGSAEESRSEKQRAFFIPSFKPKSTVIMKNAEVELSDFLIKTLDGESVNSLFVNEDYVYSYKVRFGIPLTEVSFGMALKTEKGLVLSWMVFPGTEEFLGRNIRAGDVFQVETLFRCVFTRGNYFVDSDIHTQRAGEKMVLTKVTDAFVFKVRDEGRRQKGGICDTIRRMEIKKL